MELTVGTIITGKVTTITKFGAFVALPGGKSGLVHISEVSGSFVTDVHDFLTEGQEVPVKVLSISPEGKISHVTLTAGGVDQAWKLKAMRDMLHSLGDKAQNIVQRSYTVGLAIFELDTPVKVEELAEAMVLKPPQGLKLQVVETSAGKIEIRAAPAQ